MIIPTVHMNGDRAQTLIESHEEFHYALTQSLAKLPEVNGRNYYPQGAGAFDEAVEQRQRWITAIDKVQAELMEIMQGIIDQTEARK